MPTVLGIIFILALSASLSLARQVIIFRSGASGGIIPKEVKITNITNDSFAVSWVTDGVTNGMVELIDNGEKKLVPDTRDKTGELGDFKTHYVRINGLGAEKEYQFVVVSKGKRFYQTGERPYQLKTGRPISGELPKANLASGTVKTSEGLPAEGAIVYVAIDGISPLSSLVTNQGNWAISLAKAFALDLSGLANYQEGEIIENIFVQGGSRGEATALVFTKDDDPVSPIILGGEHDFREGDGALGASPLPTLASESKFEAEIALAEKKFKIISPSDGEVLKFARPEIFGAGPGGDKVKIVLQSAVIYEADLEIENSGDWSWVPPQNLEPGSHTLTVKYYNSKTGEEETFVRSFVLAASLDEEGPYFSATPSGATVTPTPTGSPTPTLMAATTAAPTPTPKTPPRTSQPSTESGVPEPGFWQPTYVLIGGGIILFLGIFLGLI